MEQRHLKLVFLAAIFMAPQVVRAAAITSLTTTPGGTLFLGSGTRLTDSANLSGGVLPTGTITFQLLNPTNVVVDTETVPVSGNGTYSTPVGLVPIVAGTYEWVANYSGDSLNLSASSGFGNEPESVSAPATVPEPSSMALLCVAGAAMGLFRRRQGKKGHCGASKTVR